MSSYIPSSRRLGSIMISRTSSGVARKRMLESIALTLTDLPVPVEPAISRCGIVARSLTNGSPWMVLPSASVSLRRASGGRRPIRAARACEICSRFGFGNLDADGGLAGDAVDQHRLGLHRQAEVVGEAGDLAVLHAGVRLELVGRDDRARGGSGRPCLRPRTRGTSLRAAARRPSARARRSCARPWARRAAPAAAARRRRSLLLGRHLLRLRTAASVGSIAAAPDA